MKTIIQETKDILITREFCPFTWREERFIKDKHTGEESMFAEDVARLLGYSDIHAMITDPQALDLIDLATLSPGIYPLTTVTIAETKKLVEHLQGAPLESAEFFEETRGENSGNEIKDELLDLVENNPTVVDADVLSCPVRSTCGSRVTFSKEFAIQLYSRADSADIILTEDDLTSMLSFLKDHKPA